MEKLQQFHRSLFLFFNNYMKKILLKKDNNVIGLKKGSEIWASTLI